MKTKYELVEENFPYPEKINDFKYAASVRHFKVLDDVVKLERCSFMEGYISALSWTPLVTEKPPYGKKVLIKIKTYDGYDYCVASMVDADGVDAFFSSDDVSFFIDADDIVGWREIEG